MGRIKEFLAERKAKNLLRILHPADSRCAGKICFNGREYIDLSSNDYLGLSSHPVLKQAAQEAIVNLGLSASASRLLSGNSKMHQRLEEQAAAFKGKQRALIYNSGYQANVGIISALCKKGDVIFSDRLNHASIIDGIVLSGAQFIRFRHNDLGHLEALLKKERGKFKEALIATETIFSMEGDQCPLKEIADLKERYHCRLFVDEAHATGVFGKTGAGVVEEQGLTERVDLIMGTFSKALGSFGAYIASTKEIINYLINASRSFIYSTALPPAIIAVNLAGLDLIKNEPFRRQRLLENARYFREALTRQGFVVRGSSQIIPLILGTSQRVIELSKRLKARGYWALPIRPPTVPSGEARVRFSLTYHHSREVLEKLVEDIWEVESRPSYA